MILFLIGPAIIHACDIIDTSHFLLIHAYVLLYYGVNVCVYVIWVFLPEINLLTYLLTIAIIIHMYPIKNHNTDILSL